MTILETGALLSAAVACLTDVRSARIPNVLTFASLASAVAVQVLAPAGHGGPTALAGALAGFAVFLPLFLLGGMGAGDVKLMTALGAWLGWGHVVWLALYTAIAGGLLALAWSAGHGYARQAFANLRTLAGYWLTVGVRPLPALTLDEGRGPRLPYAVPMLAGVVMTIWRH